MKSKEISSASLRAAYGNQTRLQELYNDLILQIFENSRRYATELGVGTGDVMEKVLDRMYVGEVNGQSTIVQRTTRLDRHDGKREPLDRDLIGGPAGALSRRNPGRALMAYVRTAVRMSAKTLARRAERSRFRTLTPDAEPADDGGRAVREDKEWIRAAVRKLPTRERRVVRLVFFAEKTKKEAAAVMGLSRRQFGRVYDDAVGLLREQNQVLVRS